MQWYNILRTILVLIARRRVRFRSRMLGVTKADRRVGNGECCTLVTTATTAVDGYQEHSTTMTQIDRRHSLYMQQ
jgi:hypothetical protein